MKEGKHIEYARSLLEEMKLSRKSAEPQRCPTPPRDLPEQENLNQSDANDWFENVNDDEDVDGDEFEVESEAALGRYITKLINLNILTF